jgi:hypothetical protein
MLVKTNLAYDETRILVASLVGEYHLRIESKASATTQSQQLKAERTPLDAFSKGDLGEPMTATPRTGRRAPLPFRLRSLGKTLRALCSLTAATEMPRIQI